MDIETAPIPKRLSDSQEVNRFLDLCERFEKENKKEIIKEYASEALSRFHVKTNQSDDGPNLVASQGSRPLTISIRVSGTKEKIPLPSNPPPQNSHKVIPYRQLNSKLVRVNARSLNSYVSKLKTKRRILLEELSDIREEAMSSHPIRPNPLRQKCHYDYFLEESVLVANDFIEERKWKIQVAYILAHEAQAFYYEHIHNKQTDVKTDESTVSDKLVDQHKQISHFISSMVNEFWNNVKEAQTEVFHSEQKEVPVVEQTEPLVQFVDCGEASHDKAYVYASKPATLAGYLDYCYQHKVTGVVACVPGSVVWESTLYSLLNQIRLARQASFVLLPEEWKELAQLMVSAQFSAHSVSVAVATSMEDCPAAPQMVILFTSMLQAFTEPLPVDLTHSRILLVLDDVKGSLAPAVLQQLLHAPANANAEALFQEAVFSVASPQSSTRSTRQPKDLDEGGEVTLPVERHTIPLDPWQTNIRDALLDTFKEKLGETPSSTDVLQAMYILSNQVELEGEDWSPLHACALPPLQIAWPLWLWSVLVPSPYFSVLTSSYDIRFYSSISLRKKEIMLLLTESPSSLVFNHGCDMYEPHLLLKEDTILSEPLFEKLRCTPSVHPSLFITETPVITETPQLTGSSRGYNWIPACMKSFQNNACKHLSPAVPDSTPASCDSVLTSPRIKHLIAYLSEARQEKKKQVVICDSEAMAYSVTRHCYKAGYRVIELTGNPVEASASFWNSSAVLRFNNASATTIGLICLRRFNRPDAQSVMPSTISPMVDMIYMMEKPKPNYWQQMSDNILFMLSCRRNAQARVIEIYSEMESRISFSVTEEAREDQTNSSLHALLSLSSDKGTRPSPFAIFSEAEWLGFEEYYDSNGFLWKENEEFPAVKNERSLIVDMECIDPSVIENEKKLQIQSLLSDMPILNYCFAIANKHGIETSTLSAVQEPIDIQTLLNPYTITKQFEFPCYPVPSSDAATIVPFPTTVRWNKISELENVKVEYDQQPNQMEEVKTIIPIMNSENTYNEYTAVERSLLAWETAMTDYHNTHPDTEMDSFLYSTLPVNKNRMTNIPDSCNTGSSLCISVSVNKSNDAGENGKNKRNRKRQRDGFEPEEKPISGSVGKFICQLISRPYVWSQVEDELLCALVMQFGMSWSFICSVLLLEKINQVTRTRRDCTNRWEYLTKNKTILAANLPVETRYLCIPKNAVSTATNPFFYYTYNIPLLEDKKEEESKPESPFSFIFKNVQQKKVRSSLNSLLPPSESVTAKIKERDKLFATEEGDKARRLQFHLRPNQPNSLNKELLRRSVNTRAMQGSSPVNTEQVKSQSNRVQIIPFRIQNPPNYIDLRKESINNLPTARISITDEKLFNFLLMQGRTPQQGIVIPYKDAIDKARRTQEDKLTSMELSEAATKTEVDSVVTVPTHISNGITFDSVMTVDVLEDRMSDELEVLHESELSLDEDENQTESTQRPYSSISHVVELESTSLKREREAPAPETTVIDLKLQKQPISSLKRSKRIEPSTLPKAFYTPASHLSRNNVRFLQHCLNVKKQQLRNPQGLIQSITNPTARRDAGPAQSNMHQGRDVQETMSYDRQRQTMARVSQAMPYTNNNHLTPQRPQMRANPQQQQQHIQSRTVMI